MNPFFALFLLFWGQATAADKCIEFNDDDAEAVPAYLGWPHTVRCGLLRDSKSVDDLYFSDWIGEDDEVVQCLIWQDGAMMFNESATVYDLLYTEIGFFILELENYTSKNFTIEIMKNNRSCGSMETEIIPLPFNQITCHDHFEEFVSDCPCHASYLDYSRKMICHTFHDIPGISEEPADEYQYKWMRNCSGELPEGATIVKDGKEVHIDKLHFEHAGIYTCAVTYKNMTQYVRSFPICISNPPIKDVAPLVACDMETKYVQLGKDAEFSCIANFGEGVINPTKDVSISWKRSSNELFNFCSTDPVSNKQILCWYEDKQESCFLYVPDEDQRQIENATLLIKFVIRNVTENEFDKYDLVVVRSNTPGFKYANLTLELRKEVIPVLLNVGEIVGFCIGAILLATILLLLLIYIRTYQKVLYKRYLTAPIEDDRSYGATLVYNFSSTLDKFAKESTVSTITKVREVLERIGYKVFDQQTEGYVNGYRINSINKLIGESHRIIIYVTREFIKDDWKVMTLQTGFEEVVNSRSKLILILSPGIKAHVKQLAHDDDTCRLLQRAIEINCVIQRPKNINNTRFKWQLEGAMPKLIKLESYANDSFK